MNTAPRVSIIMPAYKSAPFMDIAIQPAFAQTEQDFELIIVDDFSPDDTRDVIERFAASDARIRPIYLDTNGGAAAALNRATDAARGRWVALLDSDDWYSPTRLRRLLNAGEAAGVDMVADNQCVFDLKAGRMVGTAFPRGGDRKIGIETFLAETDPTAAFDLGMLKPVFRTEFIRKHQVEYREYARHGYDYWVLLDYFRTGGVALLVDEPLYYYVQPFGTFSREWAQEGRMRYPFAHIKAMNDRVVAELRSSVPPTVTPGQLSLLKRRGRKMAALEGFAQLGEHLRAHKPFAALRAIATSPAAFWPLAASRGFDFARRTLST